ncbi:Rust resistance kinase Lr10 [Linum perenne]
MSVSAMISSRFILLLLLLLQTCQAAASAAADGGNCKPSSCGKIPIIKHPFRLTTDPKICGDYRYNLSCESNTTVLYMRSSSARYYVQEINYHKLTIRLVDDGLIKGNCSSFPATPLSLASYSASLDDVWTLISCENPMVSSTMFTKIAPCIKHSSPRYYYYAVIAGRSGADLFSLGKKCKVEMMTLLPAEEFIQNHNLMPIRYSYSNIKNFTGGFKDKLGEGGFGSVYKCKLRSGSFAAVKILGKKSTAGGVQDFINEVATIGRIHHTNVVRLIGFCSEGSKRALVYEFMPNGSLDKYIFRKQQGGGQKTLSLEQLYRISIGVARGIEYLHSGCAMQILHFDIKPHNVLLDDNFNPKLSDFGLAKLYNAGDRVATLTAVRGTIGYMAPELFYKNIGIVSHKADVYSFGMLLLDMAEKRNNSNAEADHSSQVYFPFWVHDQVSTPGTSIAVGDDVTEEENDVAKKMVIVGLWCIQTNPESRPPMNKVLEMLEGELESLPLPPRPVLYAGESVRNYEEGSSSCFVSSSLQYTQSIGQSSGEQEISEKIS